MVLFLIPPDDDDAPLDENVRDKALLDAEELAETDLSLDKDKVELDLDDAPFLEEEEEEEEEGGEDDLGLADQDEEARPTGLKALLAAIRKDKRIVIAIIVGGILLLGLLLSILFWPSKDIPEPPTPPVQAPKLPEETAIPEEPPPPPEHIVAFKPFLVEHISEDGTVRLLRCSFSMSTDNEKLAWEITHKRLVLRDAIFYYLKNKDLPFLTDKKMSDQLKKDLLSVVNQYLNVGQVEVLLVEEYLVK